MSGFIKIARKMLEWEWYTDTNVKILFLHLLLKVNWKDSRFQGREVPRGSLVTSVASLCDETGLTIKQVRTALAKLEKTGEVGKQTASKFTIISIIKYALYQDEGEQGANEGQTKGKRGATIEEGKKERRKEEENKYFLHGAPQADSAPPSVADAVITLPLNAKGQEHAVTQTDVDEWQSLYPAVDVMQELRNAKGWLIGNPSRRKTKSGIGKFLHSWLAKAQNQGGTQRTSPSTLRASPETGDGNEAAMRVIEQTRALCEPQRTPEEQAEINRRNLAKMKARFKSKRVNAVPIAG